VNERTLVEQSQARSVLATRQ